MTPAYRYRARAEHVLDGDTIRLNVDLGFRCAVIIEGRLRGVNCPELREPGGEPARAFTQRHVKPTPYPEENPVLVVESYKDRRSFARWVVDVWVDGMSLGDLLVSAGHAQRA